MDQFVEKVEELKTLPNKKSWQASPEAFSRLLHWLDGGNDSQGVRYEVMRQRLMQYFDRKNCQSPLADETLQRVMKWLDEHNKTLDEEPAKVCFNTVRFVFHEYLRKQGNTPVTLTALPPARKPMTNPVRVADLQAEKNEHERQLQCLEKSAQKLAADDRDLIVRYYYGEQRVKLDNRKLLANEFGLTANALVIKACRIRDKLRGCVTNCLCE